MQITHHTRLGPSLFILLGIAAVVLGYWLPIWGDRQYPPEFDTRIGFVIGGFAPLTTGCALLAVYGYYRLLRSQRTTPTDAGQALLVAFLIPVILTSVTGMYLAPAAIVMLPSFISNLLESVLPF